MDREVELVRCEFYDNEAVGEGGAVLHADSSDGTDVRLLSIEKCVFKGNTAAQGGGAVASWYLSGWGWDNRPRMAMANSLLTGNECGDIGGGVYAKGDVHIANCTFHGNSCGFDGGGLYVMERTPPADVVVKSCIFWQNEQTRGTPNQIYSPSGTFDSCIVQGGLAIGIDIWDADPQFVDSANPVGGDGEFRTDDDGFRLQSGSPAIDTGTGLVPSDTDISTDFADAPRPMGYGPDLGCYERSHVIDSLTVYDGWNCLCAPQGAWQPGVAIGTAGATVHGPHWKWGNGQFQEGSGPMGMGTPLWVLVSGAGQGGTACPFSLPRGEARGRRETRALLPGWNMVGGGGQPMFVRDVIDDDGAHPVAFTWSAEAGVYVPVDMGQTVPPGHSVWVYKEPPR
jgi:hypothetical protein